MTVAHISLNMYIYYFWAKLNVKCYFTSFRMRPCLFKCSWSRFGLWPRNMMVVSYHIDINTIISILLPFGLACSLNKFSQRPLQVSCHYYSFSQHPRLRGDVSPDRGRRRRRHSGVRVQRRPAARPHLEEGRWVPDTEHLQRGRRVPRYWCCCSLQGAELTSDPRRRVLSGGRQLQISGVRRTDAASYTCSASSAAGATAKRYSLQVYGTGRAQLSLGSGYGNMWVTLIN